MVRSKIGEAVVLKAEKEALKLKEEARKELMAVERERTKKINEMLKKKKELLLREVDKEVEAFRNKEITRIKKEAMLEKAKALEEFLESVVSKLTALSSKDKEEIYAKMKGVVEGVVGKKANIFGAKHDLDIIKKVFKNYKVEPVDVDFGVRAEHEGVVVDLTLDALKDEIKEKIEERLL